MFQRTLTTGVVAAGLVLAAAAPAHAAKPDVVEQFDDSIGPEVDEFLTEFCGFDITFELHSRGTFRAWDDGARIQVTEHGSLVLANPATGASLTNEWRRLMKGRMSETVNDDGSTTLMFHEVYNGIPERWRGSDGTILIADRGHAEIDATVTFPSESGPPTEDIQFVANGPHPILEQGGLGPELACEYLS